jgi:trehalose 6-phosphate phosphatase
MSSSAIPVLGTDSALFLDVDGTLLPIADTPSEARPDALQVRLLAELCQTLNGALALVSGRPLAELDRLYHPLRLPAAGQHGAEIRDGAGQLLHLHEASLVPLETIKHKVLKNFRNTPDLLIEDKGLSLAVHYRLAPHRREAVEGYLNRLMSDWGHDLVMQAGKMVYELKPVGVHKGHAIQVLMQASPFLGKKPLFVGDDVTDEDGFAMANELGGGSIKVGAGPTQAGYRLADVHGVHTWLQRCLTSLKEARRES